jgi:hypothetical protein
MGYAAELLQMWRDVRYLAFETFDASRACKQKGAESERDEDD